MRKYTDVVSEASDLHKNGKLLEAGFRYEHLLGNQPDDPIVLYMYGTLCSQTKHYGSAIIFLKKSVDIEPKEIPEAWHNLAIAYRSEGHLDLARTCNKKCLELRPDDSNTLSMLSGCYVNTGEPGLAIEYARKAIAIDDSNAHAHNHMGLALLELGRYAEAWPYYERRYELTEYLTARPFTCPRWDGGKVKKLAIHGEQGLGDEIMFMSCFDELRHLAEEIVVECAVRLVPLFEANWPDVSFYGTYGDLEEKHPDCDAYIPMGSLMTFVRQKPEDFPGKPYLHPGTARMDEMRRKMEKIGDAPYVGIAWYGGTKGTHQEIRNPPLENFAKIVEQIRELGGTPISIQYGEEGSEQSLAMNLPHWQYAVDDLIGLTALIDVLDLIITPCQTAVHMAGAVGTECWCLVPSRPAWRYKVKGEMDWYNSVKLIRQENVNNWDAVFSVVEDRLTRAFASSEVA